MPIFEFICNECGHPFEELVRSATAVDGVVCPRCQASRVTKRISTFASKISGSSISFSNYSSAPSCSSGSV